MLHIFANYSTLVNKGVHVSLMFRW